MATEPESVYLCSKDDKHPEMGLADLACAGALDGLGSGASRDERGPVEAPSPRGYEHLVCSNGSLALDADRPVDAFDAPVEGVFQVGSGWGAKAVDLQFSRAVSFESDSEDDEEEDGSCRDGDEEEKHYADPDEAHHDAVRWKLELGRDAPPPRPREKTAEERARDRLSRATVVAYLCILCVVVVAIVVCLLLFWQRGPDDDDDDAAAAAAAAAAADSNATAAGEMRRRV